MPNKLNKILKNKVIISTFLLGLVYFVSNYLIFNFYPNSSGISKNYSDDMDIVELFIDSPKTGRTDLCVPEAYLTYSKDMRREVKNKIRLKLHYPSMVPWNIYEARFKEEHLDIKSWPRTKIRAFTGEKSHLRLLTGNSSAFIRGSLSREFLSLPSLVNGKGEFEEIKDGLWQFKREGLTGDYRDKYFVSPNPNEFSSVLKCNTSKRCTLETFVTDKMIMEFNFSKSFFEDWKGLRDNVKTLASSLICNKE